MVNHQEAQKEIKEIEKALNNQAQIEVRLNYILKDLETQLKSFSSNSHLLDYHFEKLKEILNEKKQ